jgi:hypothetical protein
MAETASFSVPILVEAGVSTLRMASFTMQVFPDPILKVMLHQWQNGSFVPNGKRLSVLYTGAQAVTAMNAINTGNFSTVTLRERVMERLIADGKLTNCSLI